MSGRNGTSTRGRAGRLSGSTGFFRLALGAVALVAGGGCAASPAGTGTPADPPPADARAVLAAAREALGGTAVDRVSILEAVAQCEGPSGEFRTRVVSARDGRMVFEQVAREGRFLAAIDGETAWTDDEETGESGPADGATRAFLRGHELHALALFPEARLRDPALVGTTTFAGRPARAVRFLDELGGEVVLHFAVDGGLPLGLTTPAHLGGHGGEVAVTFAEWDEPGGGVRLFRAAAFLHGDQTWTYRFEAIDLAAPAERLAVARPG